MTATDTHTFTNWAGNQHCTPTAIVQPTSVQEVQEAVTRATGDGLGVRVRGAGHSWTPLVVTDDVMLDVARLHGVRSVDTERSRVTVGAGTTVEQLGPLLWDHGLSLSNQGDIDAQTVGGAISTATHGSGLQFTGFSGAVTAVELVTASGDVVRFDEGTPELDGARTALGSLGVITAVQLQAMPAYRLAERIDYWPLERVLDQWEFETSTRRHFSFFWGPFPGSLAMYGLGADPEGITDPCFVKRYDQLAVDDLETVDGADRLDRAYRVFPQPFDLEFYELEYFVPFAVALDAVDAARRVILSYPEQRFPLEVRTIRQEPGWLSPMYGSDAVSLSVSGVPNTDYEPFLRAFDRALQPFSARPHWGKMHYFDAERLQQVYPEYQRFVDLRRRMDPDGVFLNDHLTEMVR
ncbi:D-arabinono-1,4-lactone oxidase [uncultured Amnibacterium sp.]|uniref:D-arabinono-1,4-lactone oxidase n=1 Tax=uncultured Amnibacterium sp. TaxID=1631851 RepID=UPI0035CB072E